jgi:hypothetical protein
MAAVGGASTYDDTKKEGHHSTVREMCQQNKE